MNKHAKATFKVKTWDENPYNEIGGPKLTRVTVKKSYQGEIEGEATLEYLMMYREDGSASFVGMERVVGKVAGRSGSFVLQHSGTYANGIAKATCVVVPGSGTGELVGIQGEIGFESGHEQSYSITFDYSFIH